MTNLNTPNRMNIRLVVLSAMIEFAGICLLVACMANMTLNYSLFDNVWPIAIAGIFMAGVGTILLVGQLRRKELDQITGRPIVKDGK